MALTRLTEWVKQTLTFQSLNAEFNNILNNPVALISPLTATLDMDGKTLIMDADGDSSLSMGSDDVLVIALGGGTEYTASATVFDFKSNRLDLDSDNDTSIRASADDVITIEIGGSDKVTINATTLDIDGLALVLDADGDSSLTTATDDELLMTLRGFEAFYFNGNVASSVNGLTFAVSATGDDVTINAHGDDTNIDLGLVPKGSGTLAVTNSISVDGGFLTGAVLNGSGTRDVPSRDQGESDTFGITVTGAVVGDFAMVSTNATDMGSGWQISGMVTATNTVTVVATNRTGLTSNPASATFYARVLQRT